MAHSEFTAETETVSGAGQTKKPFGFEAAKRSEPLRKRNQRPDPRMLQRNDLFSVVHTGSAGRWCRWKTTALGRIAALQVRHRLLPERIFEQPHYLARITIL